MRRLLPAAALLILCLRALQAPAQQPADYQQWRLPAQPSFPADNPPTPERVELGRLLFFDKRLSGDGRLSCASCHVPELGWSDGRRVAIGHGGKPMLRNSQSLINVGYANGSLMWAGQSKSLEEQVSAPLLSPDIMAADIVALMRRLNELPAYRLRFEQAYPGEGIQLATIAKALASFQRGIVSRDSPFDRWLAGDTGAMAPQQLRGLVLFTSRGKANCASCHSPPQFSDGGYYNLGLSSRDPGRYVRHPVATLKGAFRTPQLRDAEHKAPYMHDGSLPSLEAVVAHYNRGGGRPGVGTVSPEIRPLKLSRAERDDLVAFLKALSGPLQRQAAPPLP